MIDFEGKFGVCIGLFKMRSNYSAIGHWLLAISILPNQAIVYEGILELSFISNMN